jgi:tripartite-type tricarboxylate transporter receptor subunit TctC
MGLTHLMTRSFLAHAFAAITLVICPAYAQNWPLKPVRIITAEPGTGNDLIARLIVPYLSNAFGQQFIVDNRGLVAVDMVAKAAPDGYTLLSYGPPLWLTPLLRQVSYDPLRDLAPITLAGSSPNILAIHPSVPAKSVSELLLLARQRPGELNYSSSSTGSSPHLAAELFKSMAGINIVRVPYKGSSQALVGLVGGQVHLMFPNAGTVAPHLKSTRVRALAVTTSAPSALVPGLPTLSASGVTGYESASQFALFAPAGTPSAIIERLNREMIAALRKPDVSERLFGSGVEVTTGTPTELAVTMKSEMAKWGKLIKEAGIREE